MAVPKILTGLSYSEDELNELGYYKANSMMDSGKDACIKNLLGVRFPTKYMIDQGIISDKEIHGNMFYIRDADKEHHPPMKSGLLCNYSVYEEPLSEMSIYGRGNNFLLLNEEDEMVCAQYKKNNSVLVDECIWGVSKDLARHGICSFMLTRETCDTDIMKAAIDLRLMGIVTEDQIFGLHNGAKNSFRKNKKNPKNNIMNHIMDYEKLKPFIKEKLILCDMQEPPKSICEKVLKKQKMDRPLYTYYKFNKIYPYMEAMFSE